jgi:hypothetical protein
MTIRGLKNFITEVKECQDKSSETRRVDQEMAKIRGKFTNPKVFSN